MTENDSFTFFPVADTQGVIKCISAVRWTLAVWLMTFFCQSQKPNGVITDREAPVRFLHPRPQPFFRR